MSDENDMSDPARAFLGGGVKGAPGFFSKGDGVGTIRRGIIKSWKMDHRREYRKDGTIGKLLYYDDNNKMEQLIIICDSDMRDPQNPDDIGERRYFLYGEGKKALQAALEAAGVDFIGRGGVLTMARVGQAENDAWLYQGHYVPPAQAFVAGPSATPGAPAVLDLAGPIGATARPDLGVPQAMAPAVPGAAPPAAPVAAAMDVLGSAGLIPTAAPALDPSVVAALAALSPDERRAMGLPG